MRYFAPRQNAATGKWHFTVQEGREIKPVGPCAEGCPGHARPEDAITHYASYLLDKRKTVLRDGRFRSCMICGGRTNKHVRIGRKELDLCEEHLDTESLLRFVDAATLMRDEHGRLNEETKRHPGLVLPP